ncbi:hypothetical protein ABIB25_000433 [Nakamurella sp. UYEF19]|uniref:type VII secretion target n=1 Tax=Nakamurella sp. UYEF19 TaxID=1756392 RepID=UPI0033937196
MPGNFDLEVDTDWIRRSASTLEGVAARFRAVPAATGAPVSAAGLGGSPVASQAAALVNLRTLQADEAGAQLGAVASGLAGGLRVSAEQFDRFEQAIRPEPR